LHSGTVGTNQGFVNSCSRYGWRLLFGLTVLGRASSGMFTFMKVPAFVVLMKEPNIAARSQWQEPLYGNFLMLVN
jgi:hypothetical protein